MNHNLSFIEVIPDQTSFDSWKEVVLNTGCTQSTLQDIKITERAGGFCYNSTFQFQCQYFTRNRFIYWKVCHDVLELVEQSLDINLYANKIRYKFIDTPILDGVSIHETNKEVIILVPTVCSVHRLVFPHPTELHRKDEFLEATSNVKYPSIFAEAANADMKDSYSFYVFLVPKFIDTQIPHVACSSLGLDKEGIFLLAYPSGDILLISHFATTESFTYELKAESIFPRILTGWADKFKAKIHDFKNVVGACIHKYDLDTYGLTLCQGGNIKFWSLSKRQCIADISILNDLDDHNQTTDAYQNFVLQKAVGSNEIDSILGVYVNFTSESKFFILKWTIVNENVEIKRLHTVHAPEKDLIHFTLSVSHIWSIWRTEAGSSALYSTCFTSNSHDTNVWTPVILESLPNENKDFTVEGDPRQLYLQHIFHPGRFPLNIIYKALNIYKKSSTTDNVNISANLLKQKICLAVENEIRSELKEAEVSDEDYLECANWCWHRFYSCCVQYYVTGLKPLSILLLPSVSGAVLLKKQSFSFLRPMDLLEHMVLCNDYVVKGHILCNNVISENTDLIESMMKFLNVIVYLEQQVGENFDCVFEKELSFLRSPNVVIGDLIEKIRVKIDSEFLDKISKKLSICNNLYQTIHKLLELIRLDNDLFEDQQCILSSNVKFYFCSQLGTCVISKCIQQQAKLKFIICRNLLLVCNILLGIKNIEWNTLEAIRSVCIPELVIFTQANFVVLWLGTLSALPFFPQQSSIQTICSMKSNVCLQMNHCLTYPISLLDLFIDSVNKYVLVEVSTNKKDVMHEGHWHISLLPLVNRLFHIICPINNCTLLPEWLLANNQHLWLQQYTRYLKNWCEGNSGARCFLLGVSLLNCGEHYKATECFQLAVKGLMTDPFFSNKLLTINESLNQSEIYTVYYLKVIKLLEFHNARDCAVKVSNTALSRLSSNDSFAATLYSIKFRHHLELKHYELAYDSLNSNPDAERKKDNLRDLVKKLLDEKKFDILLKFTYGHLEELFCDILFTRARAMEGIDNLYYDLLYAYHIKRGAGFFRLAAAVMYEQAIRLDQSNTIESLSRQVKCLLAANNILNLCNPKYAWVAKPSDSLLEEIIAMPKVAGSKTDTVVLKFNKTIEVTCIGNINKEMKLLCAKLNLVKFETKYFQPDSGPNELIFMLSSAGLFKDALRIAYSYSVSMVPILEHLTKECILLDNDTMSSPIWLIENDLQDLPIKRDTIGVAWKLLEQYLMKYEKENESLLHYAVGKKMISMQIHLPHWFVTSYKKRNPTELLNLLSFHGRIQEAIDVAIEYLLAVMGCGKELYGLTYTFASTRSTFGFAVHAVDSLIYEAEQQIQKGRDCPVIKGADTLKALFIDYLATACQISKLHVNP